jgi:hypothetical protein
MRFESAGFWITAATVPWCLLSSSGQAPAVGLSVDREGGIEANYRPAG